MRAPGCRFTAFTATTETPDPAMLAGLDALLFDIQDIGVRYGTYLSTMVEAMEAAAENGLRFVVLDRPNPLGGVAIEGPLVEEGLRRLWERIRFLSGMG